MIERWIPKLKKDQCLPGLTLRMWTDKEGEYILYTDHIASIAEKDREIERLRKDVARYKKVRQLNVNEFHNLFVKSISDNRSFDTLVDELDNINAERIDDGFGCTWSKTCPNCGGKSMEIVRPGKAQCSICG